ncbi:hypothetical protein BDN70DRAFT_852020 [Pholiota conissans]|uniref:Uncharacterized protein n=1 Tax=Pholiota conissans TaxID=109636 RepID=A0A9P5Z9D9_9AGAR|nr:hypothetical protein BDN70DRAFT_852020 [Pholiota conissans]
MIGEHIDESSDTLPPIPTALRLSTHISRLEEERIGVEAALTSTYRDTWDMLNSDALAPEPIAPSDIDMATEEVEGNHSAVQQTITTHIPHPNLIRKRAYSSAAISIATSASSYRKPSSKKVVKLG